jgi:hypothetical protein
VGSPWVLLGLAVSAAMVVSTPFMWRNRGARFGLRWFAVALLPAGLALTGLLTLVGRVSRAVTSFFGGAVFSPMVWTGYALIGAAVLIWLVARFVGARSADARGTGTSGAGSAAAQPAAARRGSTPAVEPARASVPAGDDDFADIEAILKRRGI